MMRGGLSAEWLPDDVRDRFAPSLIRSLTRDDLMSALHHAVGGLLDEGGAAEPLASAVRPSLEELTRPEAGPHV